MKTTCCRFPGLQHLVFCERQWALIHIEQLWEENRLTAEGRVLHERAHESGGGDRGRACGWRAGCGCVRCGWGLSGQADVVEFQRHCGGRPGAEAEEGLWRPFPVEYKRGRPKPDAATRCSCARRRCAWKRCSSCAIPEGALFYGTPRRRQTCSFDASLRAETEGLAARMHELYRRRATPRAVYEPKCDNCSLIACCLPRDAGEAHRAWRGIWRGRWRRDDE